MARVVGDVRGRCACRITTVVACFSLVVTCSFWVETGRQSYGMLGSALLTVVSPTFGAGHRAIIARPRYLLHSRLQAAAEDWESADVCVGMSQEQCFKALSSAGYRGSIAEIARSEDGNGNLGLAALGIVLLAVGFFFSQAMVPEKQQKKQNTAERRDMMKELYKTWGSNFSSKPRIEPRQQQNASKPSSEPKQQQDARASRRLLKVESRASDCRVFWSVDRWGRDCGEFNDTYSLLNHINMAKDTSRIEAFRSALEQTVAGRRVLDVGGGAFCLLSRLALRAGACSVDCVEQSKESVEHAIGIFKSEERGMECEGLQSIDASILEKFSDVSCDDRRDSPKENPQLRLSLRDVGQSIERELQLFQGLSSDVPLGGGYNLVVHEILGHIASAEGVGAAILDLSCRSLLAPDCVFVPCRAVTMFAPTKEIECSLEEQLLNRKYGGEMIDLRCDTKYHAARFSEESFLATPAIFEDLNFGVGMQLEQTRTVEFHTTCDGVFDGLHFYMVVDMVGEYKINTLLDETSWETTYVRLFKPGIFLPAGSRIGVKTHVQLNKPAPEYAVEVIVKDHVKEPVTASFSWSGST